MTRPPLKKSDLGKCLAMQPGAHGEAGEQGCEARVRFSLSPFEYLSRR